jgi:DDE_Tnp_1-associated/Transposase DDE domain
MTTSFAQGSLLAFLAEVPDPRSRHGRQHPLSAILALACCAILCGARSIAAIAQFAQDHDLALMHRLGFTRRPPKRHGIRKVLLALEVTALEHALTRWAEHVLGRPLCANAGEGVPPSSTASAPLQAAALDGKTLRGSREALQPAVHLLSLVAHATGLSLAQQALPSGADKTNEHKAALPMLEELVLSGHVVTADAMFTHRDFCQAVRARGGHWLVFVKENQPTLLRDVQAAFAPETTGAFSPSAATLVGRDL